MARTQKTMRWLGAFTLLLVLAAACSSETPEEGGEDEAALGAEGGADEQAAESSEPAADTSEPAAGSSEPAAGSSEPADGASEGAGGESAGRESEWYEAEEFETQLAQRDIEPEGPAEAPWEQMIEPEMRTAEEYLGGVEAPAAPGEVCFSNAANDNPWRQNGLINMQQEVEIQADVISNLNIVDAEASDEKQISDIEGLVSGGTCDVLIVSPNTTAALTPAVEAACAEVPVIIFDRGVETDCPVTFVHPIGGYAFGADAADFLVENVDEGGNILALRILPGVDVLETRYVAGQIIMEEAGLNIIGAEFTEGDAANVNSIVTDYLQREEIDGVFMDAGATALAAIEAFEDNGAQVPPITGEDQQDFMVKVTDDGLTGVAPTYPGYQWRTAVIAAANIINGEEVPSEWVLPQPALTQDEMPDFINQEMPPLFYALCGCQEMPNFPTAWQ